MISLSGYKVGRLLHDGTRTLIFTAERESDNSAVIIKTLKSGLPSSKNLARIRREYEILKSVDDPGIISVFDLISYKSNLALVLEDFGGNSLHKFIPSDGMQLTDFLNIALQLVETIGKIHEKKLIHLDIKPRNILYNPTASISKLIDFGISSQLLNDHARENLSEVLEGTVSYMSPEQTGRMNRSVDYRSDYYSLGVTFYEMLTGRLPFVSQDSMELIHCHIAKKPIPLNQLRPDIPTAVSDIVLKLLSKNAEGRYKSSIGLKKDLQYCLADARGKGNSDNFEIGKYDVTDEFQIPEKLYGRESEIQELTDAFNKIRSGETEVVMISGSAGIGKSSLVNEIQKLAVVNYGLFISGKCSHEERNTPYGCLVTAFTQLIRQLLSLPENEIETWKNKLLKALGHNGQLIVDVIPELELIIGKQPPLQASDLNEEQNRFNIVFQKFLIVFAKFEHPLVFFLDDVQWIDSATLALIEQLITNPENQYLLFLGSYRDGKNTTQNQMLLFLDSLSKKQKLIKYIRLKALNEQSTIDLIAESLHADEEKIRDFAHQVHKKTGGNPYFTREFLKSLYSEKILFFDWPTLEWKIDNSEFAKTNVTENVVDLLSSKILKLPEEPKQLLKLASCIGTQFDLQLLSWLHETSEYTTASQLWEALLEGFIFPIDNNYKFVLPSIEKELELQHSEEIAVTYRFAHDKVLQATYSLIPEKEKNKIHYRIGKLLLKNSVAEKMDDRIFEILGQLNRGIEFITDSEEKKRLVILNLEAGIKAQRAAAYEMATEHFSKAIELSGSAIWKENYEIAYKLKLAKSKCEYLLGRFNEAEKLFAEILVNSKSVMDQMRVFEIKMVMYGHQARHRDSVEIGKQALKLLGVSVPETMIKALIVKELITIKIKLRGKTDEDLIKLPKMTNEKYIAFLYIVEKMGPSASFVAKEFYGLMTLRRFTMVLTHGNPESAADCYVGYAVILSALGDYENAFRFGNLAISLSHVFSHGTSKNNTYFGVGVFTNHWKRHARTSKEYLNYAYSSLIDSGNLTLASYCCNYMILHNFFLGKSLDYISEESKKYRDFLVQTNHGLQVVTTAFDFVKSLTVKPASNDSAAKEKEMEFIESLKKDDNQVHLHWFYIFRMQSEYLLGNADKAYEFAELSEKVKDASRLFLSNVIHVFYHSLVCISKYEQLPAAEQNKLELKLRNNLKLLKNWAHHCPENYFMLHQLVSAELSRIKGHSKEAMEQYENSISFANQNEFTMIEALALELAGKYYLTRKLNEVAKSYLKKSRYYYAQWGASEKVRQIDLLFGDLIHENLLSKTFDKNETTGMTTSSSSARALDFSTVIKASQVISGEIVLDSLLEKLLMICIESAGAQRGVLILEKDGRLFVEAEESVENSKIELFTDLKLDHYEKIPKSIIYFTKRTRETSVVSDAEKSELFKNDPYIVTVRPKSILCLPIIKQNNLVGILYFENNLVPDAFTPERLTMIRMLASQAAISIENAKLVDELEIRVQKRTKEVLEKNQELENTLKQLKLTQSHLIQSGKMASVGQLTAGIAHEMNNPINYITANLEPLKQDVGDLILLLNKYGELASSENIKSKLQEIDEFKRELDLPYLMNELNTVIKGIDDGAKRTAKIVKSLRNFSRLDENVFKKGDVHEDLNSAINLLQNQTDNRIEIIRNFGNLQLLECNHSEVNQVFLSMLSNAVESISGKGNIIVRTEQSENEVKISIRDNGSGMDKATLERCFEPFFTTKGIGKGTGLGLAVSYAIIEKHNGKIEVSSIVGEGSEFVISLPLQQLKS